MYRQSLIFFLYMCDGTSQKSVRQIRRTDHLLNIIGVVLLGLLGLWLWWEEDGRRFNFGRAAKSEEKTLK